MWRFTGEGRQAESLRLHMVWRCVMGNSSHFTKQIIKLSAWMFSVNLRWLLKEDTQNCPHLPEWRFEGTRFHNFELWLTGKVSKIGGILFIFHSYCHSGSECDIFTLNPLKYGLYSEPNCHAINLIWTIFSLQRPWHRLQNSVILRYSQSTGWKYTYKIPQMFLIKDLNNSTSQMVLW